MSQCPICDSPLELKEGISKKNNKPYKLEKCNNPECNDMETGKPFARFINTPQTQKKTPNSLVKTENDQFASLMSALRKLYQLVEAGILLDHTPRDLQDMIAKRDEERNK